MPTIIDNNIALAALHFGYESMRLYRIEDYGDIYAYGDFVGDEPPKYQELVELYDLRSSLDDIATEVQPTSFLILQRTLDELRDCGARILTLPHEVITQSDRIRWEYKDCPGNAQCVSTVIARWFGLSNRFERIASSGVLGDSPYRSWFDCGRIIGACLIDDEPLEDISDLKHSLQNLPKAFLAFKDIANVWLNRLSTFDFGAKGVEGWLREVPTSTVFDDFEITDYRSLCKCAYSALLMGILMTPEVHLLPDATGAHTGKPVFGGTRRRYIPLTPLQEAILGVLKGKAMMKEELARMLKLGSGGRLYKPGGIRELMIQGLVKNEPGIGYFSVASPPPTWPSASEPDGD